MVFNVVFKWCSMLLLRWPLTKPGSDSGSDRVPDRIGLESSLSVQNHYFEKSCSNNDTGDLEFFFRVACVTNKKNRFSYITRLKIHHQIENYREDGLRMLLKCLESW